MNDLLDSIRAQIYARLSSPLFGAFIISWIGWNHTYLFILFSDLPVHERFDLAERLLYPDLKAVILRGLCWPLVSSVGFILVYPFPSRWLFQYWHRREVETKKLRDEIEGQTLLTREESRKLILDSLKIRQEFEETIQKLKQELDIARSQQPPPTQEESDDLKQSRERILDLERKIAALTGPDSKEPRNPLDHFDARIRKYTLTTLDVLAKNSGRGISKDRLAEELKLSGLEREYVFDKIKETGFFEDSGLALRLSKTGRDYYVESQYKG